MKAGEVVSVSVGFAGSVHDKRIWNDAYGATKEAFSRVVLADKGYVGAKGEGEILLRPYRRSDTHYKTDKEDAKAFNRALSRIRVKVEHVFAQMKNYRVLSNLFPFHPDRYAGTSSLASALYILVSCRSGHSQFQTSVQISTGNNMNVEIEMKVSAFNGAALRKIIAKRYTERSTEL